MAITLPQSWATISPLNGAVHMQLAGPCLAGDLVLAWIDSSDAGGGGIARGAAFAGWPLGWNVIQKWESSSIHVGSIEVRAFVCVGGETFAFDLTPSVQPIAYYGWMARFSGAPAGALAQVGHVDALGVNPTETIIYTPPAGSDALEVWLNHFQVTMVAPGSGWAGMGLASASYWRERPVAVNPDPFTFTVPVPPIDLPATFIGATNGSRAIDSGLGSYW